MKVKEINIKGIAQRFRWIGPGKFMMGSPESEPERCDDELLHEVALTKGFWLAETACTQELWEAVMGNNPSRFKGKKRPVENVSWNNCAAFLEKINSLMPVQGFRLPSETEWEYACRAGTQTPFSFGDNITTKQVNYNGNYSYNNEGEYRGKTVDVRSLPCNEWGLYEMHGNVWEWCLDWYGKEYPSGNVVDPAGPVVDPAGPADGLIQIYHLPITYRVLRGGCWFFSARCVRSANRYRGVPGLQYINTGFRLAQDHKAAAAQLPKPARTRQ